MDELLKLLNEITALKEEKITAESELIMSGILDSLNIAALISYLEQRTGKDIPVGELDLMKLSTPQDIVDNFLQTERV